MKRALLLIVFGFVLASVACAQYDTLVISVTGGFYDEVPTLELRCGNPNNHIRYTINGGDPTAQSRLYTGPLTLDERMYSKSDIFRLRNCPEDQFRKVDAVDHCIVIRATVFDENDVFASETYTNSYFIRALGFDSHGLPVVSLSVDSLDLFDYNYGIFIGGVNYDPEDPRRSGNYYERGREWERWANFEFYEFDNTGVNQQCGVRTHGGNGRRFQQKTMKVIARKKYGKNRFEHPFFSNLNETRFKNLVLRPFLSNNGGCEDYICNRIAQQLDIDFMADRPSVLFLNGEYWGIYYVKENPDQHYVEDHYGINSHLVNVQMCWWGHVKNGSPENYTALQNWASKSDLSDPEQYAYIGTKIDINNFIDYYLLELFVANFDWPVNNVRFWQAGDGKFRWMFFDGDSALEKLDFDVMANATSVDGGNNRVSTFFFRKFLESPQFQRQFADRFNKLIVTTFSYNNTQPILDSIVQLLDAETHRQFDRFDPPESFYPSKYEVWMEGHIGMTRDFLRERPRQNFLTLPQPEVKAMTWCRRDEATFLQIESASFGSETVYVFDLDGKTVFSQACVLAAGDNVVRIGTALPTGLYLVKVGDRVVKVFGLSS